MPDKTGGRGPDRHADQTEHTQQRIKDLEEHVRILMLSMGSMSGYEGFVNLIDNGLANIAVQLEPLRDLKPMRTGEMLDQRVIDALETLQAAIRHPKWSGAGSLGIQELNVPYIGEPLPAESDSGQRSIAFVGMETD